MKRIGILTYHFSYNIGAMLQSYALRKAIQQQVSSEDSVEIINYRPASFHNPGEGKKDKKSMERTRKREKFLIDQCGIVENCVTDVKAIKEYDYYVAGSDQVWNPNLPVLEETSEYFLDFVRDDKVRISYAASIGEEIDDNFNERLFALNIPKFDYLSVREQSYTSFIEKFTDKKCYAVLDPTFLIDKKYYEDMMPERKKDKKFALCVTYNMKSKRRIYDLTNRYCILKKYKIMHLDPEVTQCLFLNEEETLAYSGIEEVLWAIKNAELVITDSFHFMVFSIIFHRPFYVMAAGKNSRIRDLIEYLKLEDRILREDMKLADLNEEIDYKMVDVRLEEKKQISLSFLKEALGCLQQ